MTSIRIRMLIAMLAVAMLTAGITAVLVRNQTVSAVEEAARVSRDVEEEIFGQIVEVGLFDGSWDALPDTVDRLSEEHVSRIAVTDFGGEVLADSDPTAKLPENFRTVIDPSVELAFLGDEGFVVDEIETQDALFVECAIANGVFPEDLAGPVLAGELLEAGVSDPAQAAAIEECFQSGLSDIGAVAQPVLVYLGFGADELVDLGSIDRVSILLGLAIVAAAASAFAYLVSARVSGPVSRLTDAVTRFGQGDRSQRVIVGGGGAEVDQLANAFNGMADDLEASESARSRMVSDAAHELRNPVGVLQGNLEAAQDGVFPIDGQLIDTLHDETLHLSRLLGDLQQLALADAGGLAIRPEPTALDELVTHVVSSHLGVAGERRIELTSQLDMVTRDVDPTRLQQVVSNLVSNALTYTPEGGSVAVRLTDAAGRARIDVEDTGVGLSAAEQSRVFDRFWRADESRNRHTGGAGLGLAISTEWVRAHGGTLSVESEPGHGATFTVLLP